MKVLALNSSPRGGGQSKTEWMLDHLVEGMKTAGAEVEKINLRKKKINYCIGCFTCWTKTPGKCVHKDDMTKELFPKFIAADLVVYATPLYHFTLNGEMKAFIERTLPILEPFFIKKTMARPVIHFATRTLMRSGCPWRDFRNYPCLTSCPIMSNLYSRTDFRRRSIDRQPRP